MTSLVYTGGGFPGKGMDERDRKRIEKLLAIGEHLTAEHDHTLPADEWDTANRVHNALHEKRTWPHMHKEGK